MLDYELALFKEGYRYIAGVDEVGRGCLYGDVVAACVVLPPGIWIEGIDDSKKLSPKRREALCDEIMTSALAVGIGQVDAKGIDQYNIKQASRMAMKQAVEMLALKPDYLLIDAEKIDVSVLQSAIIHGDALSQSIAAASIVAKVTRDRLCLADWEARDPGYGIAQHKGYATALHRKRLKELGASSNHRATFLHKVFAEIPGAKNGRERHQHASI